MWQRYTDKFKAFKLIALPIAILGTTYAIISMAETGDVTSDAKLIGFACALAAGLVTASVSFLEMIADAKQKKTRAEKENEVEVGRARLEERVAQLERRLSEIAPEAPAVAAE